MRPIVTITLNPALDLSISVERVEAGPKLRSDTPRTDPGGGGINVARVVRELGGDVTAFVALGGATGGLVETALKAELSRVEVLAVDQDTRQSVAVKDRSTGKQFRFVMPGPKWAATTVDRALTAIRDLCTEGALVVFSGSLPPGVQTNFPVRLQTALAGRDVIYDISGEALDVFSKASANAFVLRMDQAEAEELGHAPLASVKDTASFASDLVAKSVAQHVIIARGSEGSVLANDQGVWFVKAAEAEVNSKTGAGDSFVGGLVYALADGQTMQKAIALGAAAASAAVTTAATELCQREMVYDLLPECRVEMFDDLPD